MHRDSLASIPLRVRTSSTRLQFQFQPSLRIMWSFSNHASGLVALALMSMMIVAGNGRDAENCREYGGAKCSDAENSARATLNANENESKEGKEIRHDLSNGTTSVFDEALLKSSVLYGVLNEIVHSPLAAQQHSDMCRRNSELLFNGISNRELWAIKGIYIYNTESEKCIASDLCQWVKNLL